MVGPHEVADRVAELRAQMDHFLHALEQFRQDLTISQEWARLMREEMEADRGKPRPTPGRRPLPSSGEGD